MKTLKIIFAVVCLVAPFYAQTPGQSTLIRPVAILPSHCDATKGETVFLIGDGPYSCNATNTWTKIGSGGGGVVADTVTNLNSLLSAEGQTGKATDQSKGQYWKSGGFVHPVSGEVNVQDFGARGDGGWYSQVQCTNGSATIQGVGLINGRLPKVGDSMVVSGCGSAGADLTGTVTGGTSTAGTVFGTAILNVTASASVSSRGARWGASVDDTSAFSATFAYCGFTAFINASPVGCRVRVPQGVFFLSNVTFPTANSASFGGQAMLEGNGRSSSWLIGIGADQTAILTAPANSVPTYVANLGFQSFDYHNKSQIAELIVGGTEHTFTNNFATNVYEMIRATNTWINHIQNNRCYAATNCIHFGPAGTGPVNATYVVNNELSTFSGSGILSDATGSGGTQQNTYIANNCENAPGPYQTCMDVNDTGSKFILGFNEVVPPTPGPYYNIFRGGSNTIIAYAFSCTQVAGGSNTLIGARAGACPGQTYTIKNDGTNNLFQGPNFGSSDLSALNGAAILSGPTAAATGASFVSNSLLSYPYVIGGAQDWPAGRVDIATIPFGSSNSDIGNPSKPTQFGTAAVVPYGTFVRNNNFNYVPADGTEDNLFWVCAHFPNCSVNPLVASEWFKFGEFYTRVKGERSSIPTVARPYQAGDFYWNTNPTTGILGWLCTAAGSPGTWQVVQAINPAVPPAWGATTPNTGKFTNLTSTGVVDFSAATHTLPVKSGLLASIPATCTIAEEYFATDATAGQNEYYCTATNTWTQEITSAGGSGITSLNGATGATQTFVNGTNIAVTTNTGTGAHTVGLSGTVGLANGGTASNANTGAAGKVLIGNGSGAFVEGDPLVQGLFADASASKANPVLLGGWDGSNLRAVHTDASGNFVVNFSAPQHVIIDSSASIAVTGPLTDTQLRASAVPVSLATVPSHAVTNAGTFAVQEADGANTTLGAKADAKNAATDTTAITIMQVLKEMSFLLQNKLLVTPDSVALPANQSVNVSQINAATPLMGNGTTGTGSPRVTVSSDNTPFQVKVLGAGGATMDGTTAPGTTPTNGLAVLGGYATTLPTLTTGQSADLSTDTHSRLLVIPQSDTLSTSYHASVKFAASSTTDNAVMPGNATNTVLVTKVTVTCTQTTAGQINVELLKRSAADTSGTAANMTVVPDDSSYTGGVSVPKSYTGTGPTVGTPVGDLDNAWIGCMAPGTATPNDVYVFKPAKPIVLRGTAQMIAVNVGNAALTGGSLTVTFDFTETTTP